VDWGGGVTVVCSAVGMADPENIPGAYRIAQAALEKTISDNRALRVKRGCCKKKEHKESSAVCGTIIKTR
jgi:hypothetical protein